MSFAMLCLRSCSAPFRSFFLRKTVYPSVFNFCDDSTKKPNLYDTLGLKPSATSSEIKKAYFDLSFKYHPDRNENCDNAATKFRAVTEAYEVLGNYASKKKYDKGVPLSQVKNAPKKPVFTHDVKYQSFYDSRTKQNTRPEFGDHYGYGETKEEVYENYSRRVKLAEERFRETEKSGVPYLILIFLTVVLLVTRYSQNTSQYPLPEGKPKKSP